MNITFYLDDYRVLPRVTHSKTINHEIALNRKGDGCYYKPKDFKQHDSHAPSFPRDQEAQDYINRVTKDILKAWKKAKKEVTNWTIPKMEEVKF